MTRPSPLKINKQLDCGCRLYVFVYQDRDKRTGERITWNDFARVDIDRRCTTSHKEVIESHTQLLISVVEEQNAKVSPVSC